MSFHVSFLLCPRKLVYFQFVHVFLVRRKWQLSNFLHVTDETRSIISKIYLLFLVSTGNFLTLLFLLCNFSVTVLGGNPFSSLHLFIYILICFNVSVITIFFHLIRHNSVNIDFGAQVVPNWPVWIPSCWFLKPLTSLHDSWYFISFRHNMMSLAQLLSPCTSVGIIYYSKES